MLLELVPRGITLDIVIGDRDRIDARRHHAVDAAEHGILLVEHARPPCRSEEHTSELQSLMRISYAVFCLKKKKQKHRVTKYNSKDKERLKRDTDTMNKNL